jgi:glycosyltransferase involved in cell wall biosynthesis
MPKAVRVLFTIPNFITAGSGRAMLNIIERLDKDKFAPAVCVMRKGGSLDKEVAAMGIPFIEAPFTVPALPYFSLPFRAWNAAQVFRPYQFELWHSFHYSDDYTEPIIAHLSGASAWVYTKKNMNWGDRAWHLRTLFATRIAAQNTEMLQKFFANRLAHRKARLVPRGVDTDRFSAAPQLLNQNGKHGLGTTNGSIVATCVAQLVPVKGHPTLLNALAQVSGVELLIAGDPLDKDYVSFLRDLIIKLKIKNRVRFLGSVRDIPQLHAQSDFFILPTKMEACPVSLLEAMSCGKACIVSDIPGVRDIIEDGKNGLLVPPEDPAALAEAINRLSSSPELRTSLGAAARERIKERFSIEREVADHEDLYAGIFPQLISTSTGVIRPELSANLSR